MAETYWLKPVFIVLGIFGFLLLLLNMGTTFGVTWSEINPTIIQVLPWLVALGLGLYVLVSVRN